MGRLVDEYCMKLKSFTLRQMFQWTFTVACVEDNISSVRKHNAYPECMRQSESMLYNGQPECDKQMCLA